MDTYGDEVKGSAYSYLGCAPQVIRVGDMMELHNTINNYVCPGESWCEGLYNTGKDIMLNGDIVKLAETTFNCSDSVTNCAVNSTTRAIMLVTSNIYGSLVCSNDSADCILDGQKARNLLSVGGTGGQKLTLRALKFQDGGWRVESFGGGISFAASAVADIALCVFINCKATHSDWGGGAIYVSASSTVNVYGSRFTKNAAAFGGDDIQNNPDYGVATITIHDTCPSPYSVNTPTQGKTRAQLSRPAEGPSKN